MPSHSSTLSEPKQLQLWADKHVLAFDFGTKHIGIAIGNPIISQARPLTTLSAYDPTKLWLNIDILVERWKPQCLVVGIPNDQITPKHLLKKCREFARKLMRHSGISTYMCNEDQTSREARSILKQRRQDGLMKKSVTHTDIDKVSAVQILEHWLSIHKT